MLCCPSVHYEMRFLVHLITAMDFQILEKAREDKKLWSSYEDDGEIGPTTNMRNALARVLRYISYCYTMVSSDARMVFPTN